MTDFKHTAVSRFAAAMIIASIASQAIDKDTLSKNILQSYLNEIQDSDPSIRKATLRSFFDLIPKIKSTQDKSWIFSEVGILF